MQIDKPKLEEAARKAQISPEKAEQLWKILSEKVLTDHSGISLPKVFYYLGALIVLLALAWFADLTWEQFGGKGLLAIALGYMLTFTVIGTLLWQRTDLKTPGGLFITLAVCLIPLATYGFQRWTGWWGTEDPGQYKDFFSWIRGGWFLMEIATVVGGVIALYFYRFPFLTAPIFFALWFLSMDVTPLIFGNTENWNHHLWMSAIVGTIMLLIAYISDRRTSEDFAFWGYLFGALAFWSGLSLVDSNSEWERFLYLMMNILMLLLGTFLERTIFLILGAIGVLVYTSSLFYKYFADSSWFPAMLSLIGVLLVFMGAVYQKNRQHIEKLLLKVLPESLQNWRPKSREK